MLVFHDQCAACFVMNSHTRLEDDSTQKCHPSCSQARIPAKHKFVFVICGKKWGGTMFMMIDEIFIYYELNFGQHSC